MSSYLVFFSFLVCSTAFCTLVQYENVDYSSITHLIDSTIAYMDSVSFEEIKERADLVLSRLKEVASSAVKSPSEDDLNDFHSKVWSHYIKCFM